MRGQRSSISAAAVVPALAALALVGIVAAAVVISRSGEPAVLASPSPTPTGGGATQAGATPTFAAARTPPPTPDPGATPVRVAARWWQYPLGYGIQLLPGWSRSDIQSHSQPVANGDPENVASEIFTRRSLEGESEALRRSVGMTGPGPAGSYTAWVKVYRNSERKSTREFAEAASHGFGLKVVALRDITFRNPGATGGRPATRVHWEWPVGGNSYATYVEDEQGRMWVFGFYFAMNKEDVPPGATDEDLHFIVASFSASWLGN